MGVGAKFFLSIISVIVLPVVWTGMNFFLQIADTGVLAANEWYNFFLMKINTSILAEFFWLIIGTGNLVAVERREIILSNY